MTFTWIQGVFFAFLKCFGVESAEATMDSNMKPHACEGNSSSRNKKSFQDTSNPSLPDTQTLVCILIIQTFVYFSQNICKIL